MSYRAACCLVLWSLAPAPAVPQAPPPQPGVAIHIGVGNHYGGFGTAGEAYVVRGRLSAFVGVGVIPSGLFDFPTTVAGAVGLRYYVQLRGSRHRAFADLSMSVLAISQAAMVGAPVVHHYGPGLLIGYSYLAGSGLTLTAGAGAGRANDGTVPILQVGIGWTWRRSRP